MDPKGYFGEEEINSYKNDQKKEKKKQKSKEQVSIGKKSYRVPLDHLKNELKIKDIFDGENFFEAPEDGYFILPPQD